MAPLLTEPWYVRQLRGRHADLVLPFDQLHPEAGRMHALVDANPSRPLWGIGPLVDQEGLGGRYGFYSVGLAWKIVPFDHDVTMEQMGPDTHAPFQKYGPPAAPAVAPKPSGRATLIQYAAAASRLAAAYEQIGQYPEAQAWNQRALSIHPDFPEARSALLRITGRRPGS